MDKPLITNAADENQIKESEKKQKFIKNQDDLDMRQVLSTIQGRRVMWKMLEHCRIFESVWEPSARIHYLAGRQDVGHMILAKIVKADEEKYFQMMRESKKGDYTNG